MSIVFNKYEREITDHIIMILDISNGDAQSIVECQVDQVLLASDFGLTAEQAAYLIIQKSTVNQ